MAHGYLNDGYGIDGGRERGENDRNRDYDRGYGRDYSRDRMEAGQNRERDWSNHDQDHRHEHRHDRDNGGFWNDMKDEARSWFGSDDDRSQGGGPRHDYGDRSRSQGYGRDQRDFSSRSDRDDGARAHFGRQGSSDRNRESSRSGLGSSSSNDRYGSTQGGQQQGRSQTPDGYLIVEEYTITGPSGNQDDHYRNWRSRQMQQLDNDYQDYCREREQQFHRDFDDWRRNRGNQQSQRSDQQSKLGTGQSDMSSKTTTSSGGGAETSTSRSSSEPKAATAQKDESRDKSSTASTASEEPASAKR